MQNVVIKVGRVVKKSRELRRRVVGKTIPCLHEDCIMEHKGDRGEGEEKGGEGSRQKMQSLHLVLARVKMQGGWGEHHEGDNRCEIIQGSGFSG